MFFFSTVTIASFKTRWQDVSLVQDITLASRAAVGALVQQSTNAERVIFFFLWGGKAG